MNEVIAERDALFYPYVDFPSEDWLKAALLFSPHVYRMVATDFQPRWDTEFMKQLRRVEIDGVHLLEHADLWSPTAQQAQAALMRRLRTDIEVKGNAFKERFSKAAARAISTDYTGFQVHPGKFTGGLVSDLRDLGLAWKPDRAYAGEYWELHPAIGGAFLGSIAVACAADRGLAVVGDAEDATCRELNRSVPSCDFAAVYDDFVHGTKPMLRPRAASGEAVADVILFNHCDASRITVDDLKDLATEREPIRKLKARLHELATTIPCMLDQDHLEQRLKDCAATALNEWQADRPSFKGALKRFFGADLAKVTIDLIKGSISKAADRGSSAGSAAAPVSAGSLAFQFLGAIGGFGVGLAVHGITTAIGELTRERHRPYRYLSMAKKKGVVFSIGGTSVAS